MRREENDYHTYQNMSAPGIANWKVKKLNKNTFLENNDPLKVYEL